MVIRSADDLIRNSKDFLLKAQPRLDLKPGTVARDLFVDGPSTILARLYEEQARTRSVQSLRLALGVDLDRLGANYGVTRRQGSRSSGVALFTFDALQNDIPINQGDIVSASNGATFTVQQSITISVTSANTYRATASRYRADLDFVGISDQYAIEVTVTATAVGRLGNISKYSLSTTTTAGVNNVTNAVAFSGGTNVEDDATYRGRVLSIFGGANTGTTTGYESQIKTDRAVIDAIVVGPGDDLMTRDGTQVTVAEDGTRTVVSEGTGGKVDIYVYGSRLLSILNSTIYRDQSNKGDPTDTSNDFVLGQIEGDENKTVTRRRLENLENEELPGQPVNDIIEVFGSSSGSNFAERTVDSLGRVSGNYVLVKDTGQYAGTPWAFDKLRWIDDRIRNFSEDLTKAKFNGQDTVTFSDITKIGAATQSIQITNENSTVNPNNRSSIQLAHKPITSVTRVLNFTTGERYVVSKQNPDGTGSVNETGRITIAGNSLPAVSDILQVDYTWLLDYDPNFDFYNKTSNDNPRSVTDSVDWGFSNRVTREQAIVETSGSLLRVLVTHPVSAVVNVNTFVSDSSSASVILISGRLGIAVDNTVSSVIGVKRSSDGAELYNTSEDDGSFSGQSIFFPTDTVATVGDSADAVYNATDVYNLSSGISGSFSSNEITLPTGTSAVAGNLVEVTYIANVKTLLPSVTIANLPAIRNYNTFDTSSQTGIGTQPTTHLFSGSSIVQNLRSAPSKLQMTITGSISPGVLTISGTTITGVFEATMRVASASLTQDLSPLIKSELGIASNISVGTAYPSVQVVRLISCEQVTVNSSLDVLSSDFDYDIKGYALRDNSLVKEDAVSNSSLSKTQATLPSTASNLNNIPQVGTALRFTFYISNVESENVSYSKSGTLYTDKTFVFAETISVSSGFTSTSSQAATLTVSNLNQPVTGTRYTGTYDYLAPKSNERISVRYNQNALISDATLDLEPKRPITADVLVKEAVAVGVDVHFAVVVSPGFENSTAIVSQNLADTLVSTLNAVSLNTTVDESDLITAAGTVDGVDRVRSLQFNYAGQAGRVLSIVASKNQYIQANQVQVTIESR